MSKPISLSVAARLGFDQGEPGHGFTVDFDGLDEHRQRPYPESVIAVECLIEHHRLFRLGMSRHRKHPVLWPLVMAIAPGLHLHASLLREHCSIKRTPGAPGPGFLAPTDSQCSRSREPGCQPSAVVCICLSEALEDRADPLAQTDTHRSDTERTVVLFHHV